MKNETTMLQGQELLAKVAEMNETSATKTEIAIACGFVRDNGKPDFVGFYTELLAAKGIEPLDESDDEEENEVKADLIERFGEDAVDAFCEIWSEDDLEQFEECYVGYYASGADYAREVVEECYCTDFPSFVEIDWDATWQNLSYDYYYESGFIFRQY